MRARRSASPQPPAERERERERLGLLPVQPPQLEMRPGGVVEDLGARATKVVRVAPGDGHEAAQPDLTVARGELGLATGGRLVRLALAGRLRLAESASAARGRRGRA